MVCCKPCFSPPPVRREYRGESRRKKEYKLKKNEIGKKRNVSKRQ